jgi:hypothetical protein
VSTTLFEEVESGLRKGAEFSPCRLYRYALWREWEECCPSNRIAFVGLNPSTADEVADDPTIRRCIGFAKSWDYGGLVMLNAYAFRATDPKEMKRALEPIGPENDAKLAHYTRQCDAVIAAWGTHCSVSRAVRVCEVIGRRIDCLGKTKDGAPKHPLYLAANTRPQLFCSNA